MPEEDFGSLLLDGDNGDAPPRRGKWIIFAVILAVVLGAFYFCAKKKQGSSASKAAATVTEAENASPEVTKPNDDIETSSQGTAEDSVAAS